MLHRHHGACGFGEIDVGRHRVRLHDAHLRPRKAKDACNNEEGREEEDPVV